METPHAPRFALIGAGGYIARKHFRAIQNCGGELVLICDVHDSVGDVEPFFPAARFERPTGFWYHLSDLRPDYVVVCTPSHLHFGHCARALAAGCHVICEKPVTLGVDTIDELATMAERYRRSVHPILQLRHDDAIKALWDRRPASDATIEMRYWARRGLWYDASWKAIQAQSGGILFNLGIHGFDVLIQWLGKVKGCLGRVEDKESAGKVAFDHHSVNFSVSRDLTRLGEKRWDRGIFVDGARICDLNTGAPGLHERAYEAIVQGRGLRLGDARPSIELCEKLTRAS